ncbi:hypothetical protein BIT28_11325 [Photobacterium proteolyticum]|uniref:Uncharacterized protein n=1 Tax=Photobacterium proteolyticum TaxID=1903952 RepID=A0A1Q9G710_9GAMM|nr:hypothetical protein [Photobacterium proteolyticum]OLQ70113.1 hypothetical protein BIT28_11325 [Photobacterium proteolyticum]
MQLQQIVSKIIMLAMLFTALSSTVSANSFIMENPLAHSGCHTNSAMVCCSEMTVASPDHTAMCNTDTMSDHSAPTCCVDNDCHTNNIQFALLNHLSQISIPSASQIFPEPEGERLFFYDVILRPPVFS